MSLPGELALVDEGAGTVAIRLSGSWSLRTGLPPVGGVVERLEAQPPVKLARIDASSLDGWDSAVVTFVVRVSAECAARDISVDHSSLPEGVRRLVALSEAVPEKSDARGTEDEPPFLARVGTAVLEGWNGTLEVFTFVGEMTLAFGRLLRGAARYRRVDLGLMTQHAGADALPIVTLISLLVGMILAFVGAVQLEQFGAAIYVADLVGIAMTREMGAMMTAIVMAGRTGAAFAAQLGSMKVNQEIDALRTMGISPLEYLVLPRMLALSLMMPLLCLYADVVGILGGAVIGLGMLDLSPVTYAQHTIDSTTYANLIGGVAKATVYGVLVALASCLRGMESGDSASAVGDATTSAVVTSIVLIICASGLFAVIFYALGI